jgi:FkbM family methyltransferase
VLTTVRHDKTLVFDTSAFPDELPYVYRPMQKVGFYEEPMLEHIRSLDRRGAYIDCGAHLGTHAVWFAMLCRATRVHAFEPVARFAEVLERNVAANGLDGRLVVHRVGLSDRPGDARNRLSPEHQWGFDADPQPADEQFRVARLDDVVGRSRVAVIKLDVEGMEAAVLRGGARLLKRWRPVLYAEAHSETAVAEIDSVVEPFGYARTGRVFNSSPTYEYMASRRPHWAPAWR